MTSANKRYGASRLPEPLAVKWKALFRRKKAFWLSVGFKLNWNRMCGMWNSGTLARSQESTECELFFLTSLSCSLSLLLSLSFPSVSALPLSFFSPTCRGVLHQPSEPRWRRLTDREREREREREKGSDWNIQPSLTLTGIASNRLGTNGLKGYDILEVSHPSYFFFSFFFYLLQRKNVWDCRILTLTNFPETSECTLRFPGGISQWELQLDVWTPCTFFCGVPAVCRREEHSDAVLCWKSSLLCFRSSCFKLNTLFFFLLCSGLDVIHFNTFSLQIMIRRWRKDCKCQTFLF